VTCVPAMVIEPVRVLNVPLAEARTVTTALPVPVVADVIVSHEAVDVAVHAQPAGAVIAKLVLDPVAGRVTVVGDTAKEQAVAPACVIVTVVPPTVRVPVRGFVSLLVATVTVTLPFPEPPDPFAMVSHGAFDAAVQAHPAPAATVKVMLPPADGLEMLVGVTE